METTTGIDGSLGEVCFLPQFKTWKQSLEQLPADLAGFEKWLFLASSKVLFGGKPGELLLLREEAFGLNLTSLLERAEKVTRTWGVLIYSFGLVPRGAKIVIYRRERVNKALREARNTALFVQGGFSQFTLAEDFFWEITRRWKASGDFPHEIAISLGYPVKDVVGYLGLSPLQYYGSYGWRVYGAPEPSLQLRDRFNQAKAAAIRFLEDVPGKDALFPGMDQN